MKITKRFKGKLEQAKAAGYKRVEVTIGGHMATVYCAYYSIDELLAMPEGKKVDSGSKRLRTGVSRRTSWQVGDIGYQQIFNTFED